MMIETIKNISIIMEYIAFWVWFSTLNTWKVVIHYVSFACMAVSAIVGLGCIVIQIGEKLCL